MFLRELLVGRTLINAYSDTAATVFTKTSSIGDVCLSQVLSVRLKKRLIEHCLVVGYLYVLRIKHIRAGGYVRLRFPGYGTTCGAEVLLGIEPTLIHGVPGSSDMMNKKMYYLLNKNRY